MVKNVIFTKLVLIGVERLIQKQHIVCNENQTDTFTWIKTHLRRCFPLAQHQGVHRAVSEFSALSSHRSLPSVTEKQGNTTLELECDSCPAINYSEPGNTVTHKHSDFRCDLQNTARHQVGSVLGIN